MRFNVKVVLHYRIIKSYWIFTHGKDILRTFRHLELEILMLNELILHHILKFRTSIIL